MCNFKIIACINKKKAIGINGELLYHLSSDIKNFVRMTKFNGVLLMGRATFESLPNGEPLKDRINVVLTSNEDYGVDPKFENVYIVHSVKDAVELCEAFFSEKELFVIGGESVYRQFMDEGLVDEMRLTIVNDEAEGDAFFPEYNEDDWYIYYKSMAQTSSYEGVDKSFYYEILLKKKNNE